MVLSRLVSVILTVVRPEGRLDHFWCHTVTLTAGFRTGFELVERQTDGQTDRHQLRLMPPHFGGGRHDERIKLPV